MLEYENLYHKNIIRNLILYNEEIELVNKVEFDTIFTIKCCSQKLNKHGLKNISRQLSDVKKLQAMRVSKVRRLPRNDKVFFLLQWICLI